MKQIKLTTNQSSSTLADLDFYETLTKLIVKSVHPPKNDQFPISVSVVCDLVRFQHQMMQSRSHQSRSGSVGRRKIVSNERWSITNRRFDRMIFRFD